MYRIGLILVMLLCTCFPAGAQIQVNPAVAAIDSLKIYVSGNSLNRCRLCEYKRPGNFRVGFKAIDNADLRGGGAVCLDTLANEAMDAVRQSTPFTPVGRENSSQSLPRLNVSLDCTWEPEYTIRAHIVQEGNLIGDTLTYQFVTFDRSITVADTFYVYAFQRGITTLLEKLEERRLDFERYREHMQESHIMEERNLIKSEIADTLLHAELYSFAEAKDLLQISVIELTPDIQFFVVKYGIECWNCPVSAVAGLRNKDKIGWLPIGSKGKDPQYTFGPSDANLFGYETISEVFMQTKLIRFGYDFLNVFPESQAVPDSFYVNVSRAMIRIPYERHYRSILPFLEQERVQQIPDALQVFIDMKYSMRDRGHSDMHQHHFERVKKRAIELMKALN